MTTTTQHDITLPANPNPPPRWPRPITVKSLETRRLQRLLKSLPSKMPRTQLAKIVQNLQFTDLGSRELLTEVLSFDRWKSAHLARCPECRPTGGAQ